MNHIAHSRPVSTHATPTICHPERSLAKSEATRQTESKDPYNLHGARGEVGDFRIAIRFFDDHDTEVLHEPGPAAAACKRPARQCHLGEANRLTISRAFIK